MQEDHEEHAAVDRQMAEEQAAELEFENSCIYKISGGNVDANDRVNWIRISDMRHLVNVALPRQITEEQQAYERAQAMADRGEVGIQQSWQTIANTHRVMHDSRVKKLLMLKGVLAAVDLGFYAQCENA